MPLSVMAKGSFSLLAFSRSRILGIFSSISLDRSATISSEVFPPPALLTWGWMLSTTSTTFLLSCIWNCSVALSCIPKMSGVSVMGRPLMYSWYKDRSPS